MGRENEVAEAMSANERLKLVQQDGDAPLEKGHRGNEREREQNRSKSAGFLNKRGVGICVSANFLYSLQSGSVTLSLTM